MCSFYTIRKYTHTSMGKGHSTALHTFQCCVFVVFVVRLSLLFSCFSQSSQLFKSETFFLFAVYVRSITSSYNVYTCVLRTYNEPNYHFQSFPFLRSCVLRLRIAMDGWMDGCIAIFTHQTHTYRFALCS